MLSYQGSEVVKADFAKRFAEHRKLDQVIQGTGFEVETQRGCFIGCTMNEYSHEAFANQIGPAWLAYLADAIFEGLPASEAPQFGTDLLEAIPIGKNLEPVQWLLAKARHQRQLDRLAPNLESYAEECRKAIQGVIEFCDLKILGAESAESAELARSAAQSAAELAARSAAARSARSAAALAVWLSEFQIERDNLLAILRSF